MIEWWWLIVQCVALLLWFALGRGRTYRRGIEHGILWCGGTPGMVEHCIATVRRP